MTATLQIEPQQAHEFLRVFEKFFDGKKTKAPAKIKKETQAEVNARILSAVEAANSGKPPFITMTMEELEAMVR